MEKRFAIATLVCLSLAVAGLLAARASAAEPVSASSADENILARFEALRPADDWQPGQEEREFKGYHVYSDEVHHWFKQEATTEAESQRIEAIVAMCALYHELRTDPRFPTSDTLKKLKIKLWSRLTRVQQELQQEIDRQPARAQSETIAPVSDLALLQAEPTTAPSYAESQGAAGGGARRGDHGQELVELIQKTIAPTKWDVNGGPFTIVYYAPLHALVVRASGEAHGRVAGLVQGLRAAGN